MADDEDERDAPDETDSPATANQTCAFCGALIDTAEWYPVEKERDGGDLRLYSFCSEDCRSAWLDDRTD